MSEIIRRPNQTLAALLQEAGLTPRALAAEINRAFGSGTVSGTAAYHWRDAGRVPHAPLPQMTAQTLSARLGRYVSSAHVWNGKAEESPAFEAATAGLEGPWTLTTTRRVLDDWLQGGLVDRRTFVQMSGAALTGAVVAYLEGQVPRRVGDAAVSKESSPLVTQIEKTIQSLQRLDDDHGGAANLGYVGAQVRATALVLQEGDHDSVAARRLQVALADVAQLAGWMAFDAGRHGLAQRYWLTGLRVAHDVGYADMAAHILADLSFQAASCGNPRDAVDLGEATTRAAAQSSSIVRAAVQSRLAYAYASAGRIGDFQRAHGGGIEHICKPRTDGDPKWLYFITPAHLECQAGYALVGAGRDQLRNGNPTQAKSCLRQGIALLRNGAYERAAEAPAQRRALFEGSWLALGHLADGDIEEATRITQLAMPRLKVVDSPRSVQLLTQLSTDLRKRTRNEYARSLLPQLKTALAPRSLGRFA